MARTIQVEILGDATSLNRAFLGAEKRATAFNSRMTKLNETSRGALSASGLGRTSLLFGSTAFLGGALAGGALAKSIKAASDLNEQITKNQQVFRGASKSVQDWAKTTAESIGIARTQALTATGVFGNLFRAVNIGPDKAAQLSKSLTKLAADLASFNNTNPEDALAALRSGLVGQARPLRVYGVLLSVARVEQQAMADTGKRNAKELTDQEKVLARYEIILKDTALAQGDFQRTSEGFANQTRILKANISDLTDEIGTKTLPTFLLLIQDTNLLIQSFHELQSTKIRIPVLEQLQKASSGSKGGLLGQIFSQTPLGEIVHPIDSLNTKLALLRSGLKLLTGASQQTATSARDLSGGLGEMAADARGADIQVNTLANSLKALQTAATGLTFNSLKLEADNAPLKERIAVQQQIIANDRKIVEATASGSKARKDALSQQISDQNALTSLQSQVAQNQAQAQAKIDKLRQDAIQKENDRISGIFQSFDIKLSKAQLTPGLEDDLRVLNKELATVQELVKTHQNNLDLQQREVDLRGQILALQKQQRDAQRQALEDAKNQAKTLFGDLFKTVDLTQPPPTFLGGSRGARTVPGTGGTAGDLLANITAQNKAFGRLETDIAILAKRGAPKTLIAAAQAGQISAEQVDVLAHASTKVLERIFGQVRRADKLIASAAKMELRANTVTLDAKTVNLAGAGDRGTGGGITINGGLHLHGVQNVKQLENELTRRSKKRANQRRGRVGGVR